MDYAPFTMRQMVEAGMHFGHTTRRCNPKMLPWIFGQRNGVHIIDLEQSQRLLRQALVAMHDATADGRKILIVGTKRQAQTIVADAAKSCGQFYINRRWLGGTLTNWQTVSKSVDALKTLDEKLEKDDELEGLTKREKLSLTRKRDKLERALGGIREMSELPDLMLVIDTNKEATAIKEAQNLNIPIVAFLDSNSNPDGITYPVPANDDATRALKFYLNLVAQAVINGLEQSLTRAGKKPDREPVLEAEMARKADSDSAKGKDAKGSARDNSRDGARDGAKGGARDGARRDGAKGSARDNSRDGAKGGARDNSRDGAKGGARDGARDGAKGSARDGAQKSEGRQKETASSGKTFKVTSKVKVIAKDKPRAAEDKPRAAEDKPSAVEDKPSVAENKPRDKDASPSSPSSPSPEQAEGGQKPKAEAAVEVSALEGEK